MRLARRRKQALARRPMGARGAMVKRKSATAMSGGQARAHQIWRETELKRLGKC